MRDYDDPILNATIGGEVVPGIDDTYGMCDLTKNIYNTRDLVKQYAYAGKNLVWTGFLVGRDVCLPPNPQDSTVFIPATSITVENPRPLPIYTMPEKK